MKKFNIFIASIIFLSLAPIAHSASNDVIAKIGNKEITINDYQALSGDKKADKSKIRQEILDDLITLELISQDAVAQNIDKTDEFKKEYNSFRTILLREFYLKNLIEKELTDEIVKNEYDKNIKTYKAPTEYKAAHILVDNEKLANEISAKLAKNKNDFAELAKKHSKDSNANIGGDLGYFMPEMMVKPFADGVKSLKIGEISKAIKTEFGWHIIRLDDKRSRPAPSFKQLEAKLRSSLAQKIIASHIKKLKQQHKIEIIK